MRMARPQGPSLGLRSPEWPAQALIWDRYCGPQGLLIACFCGQNRRFLNPPKRLHRRRLGMVGSLPQRIEQYLRTVISESLDPPSRKVFMKLVSIPANPTPDNFVL